MPNKSHQWYILDTSTNKKTKALFEKNGKRHAGVARRTLCVIVGTTAYSLNKSGNRPELTVERR